MTLLIICLDKAKKVRQYKFITMSIQLQKSTIVKQLELVHDEDLLKSIQNLLDFGLRHQSNETDFVIEDDAKKMVLQRLDDYHKNPDDVMDFDVLIDKMRKSI